MKNILNNIQAIMAYRSVTELTYKAGGDGAMIAFFIPPAIAEELAIEGGESPEDLHITLAYLGKLEELQLKTDVVLDIVKAWATSQNPLRGSIQGIGIFNQYDDSQDVLYASPDITDLCQFRQSLCDWLEVNGIGYSKTHGFTPHITLKYALMNEPLTIPRHIPPYQLEFDYLSVCFGEARYDINLQNLMLFAGARNSRKDYTRIQQVHDLTVELGATCKEEKLRPIDARSPQYKQQMIKTSSDHYGDIGIVGNEKWEERVRIVR